MNSKASFSAIIGVALVVLIASIGFTYYSSGVSQKALLEQQDALELRQHWTNARFLLDKAAAEALYDSSNAGCDSAPNYKSKMENYSSNILRFSNSSISCSYSNLVVSAALNPFTSTVSFDLSCEKPGIVSFQKSIVFKKELRKQGSSCEVWDTQDSPEFLEIPLP